MLSYIRHQLSTIHQLLTQIDASGRERIPRRRMHCGKKESPMACAEENWQTKLPFINQRTKFVFNKELLSDVKFTVPLSGNESHCGSENKVIPAHKLVLAISSPVFYAMFYGEMAEPRNSIELPDCEYESLLELLRFLYSDEVNLTGSNVMQVLYLAKKYMVPSLEEKCAKFLRDNLTASNVFSILPHAQKFEDKDLEDRCWEVVERETEEALTSDEFVTLERSLVEAVVKRERLNIKEVKLFKAVDRWATKEMEKKQLTLDCRAKRRIIGDEIVQAIRFPIMSEKEFVSTVFDSEVLDFPEISNMMKKFNDVPVTCPFPFLQTPRLKSFYRCRRFPVSNTQTWEYTSNRPDCIRLTVDKAIKLFGVQHFGSERGIYTVSIEVKDTISGFSLVKKSGSYMSEKDETGEYYGFDVLFEPPLCLNERKLYEINSLIEGPNSHYGQKGTRVVTCDQVQFSFSDVSGRSNGTTITGGQFPSFVFQ